MPLPSDFRQRTSALEAAWAKPGFGTACAACQPLLSTGDRYALYKRLLTNRLKDGDSIFDCAKHALDSLPAIAARNGTSEVDVYRDSTPAARVMIDYFARAQQTDLRGILGGNRVIRTRELPSNVCMLVDIVGTDVLYLNFMYSKNPGSGRGRAALASFLAIADREAVQVVLCAMEMPRNDGRASMSQQSLENWYARNGFVPATTAYVSLMSSCHGTAMMRP